VIAVAGKRPRAHAFLRVFGPPVDVLRGCSWWMIGVDRSCAAACVVETPVQAPDGRVTLRDGILLERTTTPLVTLGGMAMLDARGVGRCVGRWRSPGWIGFLRRDPELLPALMFQSFSRRDGDAIH